MSYPFGRLSDLSPWLGLLQLSEVLLLILLQLLLLSAFLVLALMPRLPLLLWWISLPLMMLLLLRWLLRVCPSYLLRLQRESFLTSTPPLLLVARIVLPVT
jgi:hypothetical protein